MRCFDRVPADAVLGAARARENACRARTCGARVRAVGRPRHIHNQTLSIHHQPPISQGKVFIGGLDETITKEDLDAYASQWCADGGGIARPHAADAQPLAAAGHTSRKARSSPSPAVRSAFCLPII